MSFPIKIIGLILLLVDPVGVSAVEDPFRPYQLGSVYNLVSYLPWGDKSPEIIRYPIGCSGSTLADFGLQLFFPKTEGPFYEVFHPECVRHDLCYRHGYYTYQFTKEDCDDEFAEGLESRCAEVFAEPERIQCQRVAGVLALAARKFGHLSYHADDYPFRDYGYYFEYLDNKGGQYTLLWSLLDAKPESYRELYRQKVNGDLPLPSRPTTRRLLLEFFRKQIGLSQLTNRLKGSPE